MLQVRNTNRKVIPKLRRLLCEMTCIQFHIVPMGLDALVWILAVIGHDETQQAPRSRSRRAVQPSTYEPDSKRNVSITHRFPESLIRFPRAPKRVLATRQTAHCAGPKTAENLE